MIMAQNTNEKQYHDTLNQCFEDMAQASGLDSRGVACVYVNRMEFEVHLKDGEEKSNVITMVENSTKYNISYYGGVFL